MAINTFFSGPPDSGLSDISRAMIADEANKNAAAANQMQFFANLAGQRSTERLGRGRNMNDAAATAMRERVARLPYSGMTPYEAGTLELERNRQRFFENHPELFGDSRTRIANADREMELEQLTRESEAAAALANAALDAAKLSVFPQVSSALKTGFLYFGRDADESEPLAKLILDGKDDQIPAPIRQSKEYIKAKEIYENHMLDAASKVQQSLGKNALLVRIDPLAKRFASVYGRRTVGSGPASPPPTPSEPVIPPPTAAPLQSSRGGFFSLPYWMPGGANRVVAPAPAPSPVPVAPMVTNRPSFFTAPNLTNRVWIIDPRTGRVVPQ